LASHDPFPVDKVALLHVSEPDILWPVSVWGEVDFPVASDCTPERKGYVLFFILL
jgi:hypothetical protein